MWVISGIPAFEIDGDYIETHFQVLLRMNNIMICSLDEFRYFFSPHSARYGFKVLRFARLNLHNSQQVFFAGEDIDFRLQVAVIAVENVITFALKEGCSQVFSSNSQIVMICHKGFNILKKGAFHRKKWICDPKILLIW